MIIQNNKMIFSEGDKVICCRKDRPYVVGKVILLGTKYVVQLEKEYLEHSTLFWDYTVPFEKNFKEFLDENNIEKQYNLIKEQFSSIIVNNGRKIQNA